MTAAERDTHELREVEIARMRDTIARLRSQAEGLEVMARERKGHIDVLERQLDAARLAARKR